jgi:DNA polymerase-3 subunit delta'
MKVYEQLVGQGHLIKILESATKAARTGEDTQEMTHAWLFTGPPGSGRSSAAVAFASALICPNDGCSTCTDCRAAKSGTHADVEIIRTEGLSIKIEEIRELLTRVAWAPAMGGWRIVVMEDADRLTESAANALLKAIEEPGTRTVWLLCAPTLHDVLPTIRSRCRHLQLVTPSTSDVAEVLINRDGISPALANFAARASQGHIGRARYLANDELIRNRRDTIIKLPIQINDVASAFKAAETLLRLATEEAEVAAAVRDEKEGADLAQAWGKGATGRGMATGGAKAIKDLEKEQKSRSTRMIRDSIDGALIDIATLYRDVMFIQAGTNGELINQDYLNEINKLANNISAAKTIAKIDAIMAARVNLSHNAAPLLTLEALMCQLAQA